jgi:transposase
MTPGFERASLLDQLLICTCQVLRLETRHVKAALSAMMVKTDRKDACGLAHLLRMGWVHAKSI